ncbi:MAG: alanine racemase [Thermodesulfobacteriota bacterium]
MENRPTSAIIDMGALRFNYRQLRSKTSGATRMMAVVKANAYGHGDLEVAGLLEGLGCEYLGVAMPEEGARLRAGGVKAPVVVLGGVFPGQTEGLFEHDLTPVISDISTARRIDGFARGSGTVKKIHVKIDTGMGRLGLLPGDVAPFFDELRRLANIEVEAVLSHFSEAEALDRSFTRAQLALFLKAVEEIKGKGIAPAIIDVANSAATVDLPGSRLDLVRPGIMLYGSYPAPHLRDAVELAPVMSLKTRILHLKTLPAGSPVSYGRSFVTARKSTIAILPIGYGDGLPRLLSNRGSVLVRGRRAPIAGAVCMDLTMCDVTDVPGVSAGDEAVLIGRQGNEAITAEEVAGLAGTISYEIFCGISARVPRVYV